MECWDGTLPMTQSDTQSSSTKLSYTFRKSIMIMLPYDAVYSQGGSILPPAGSACQV